jgi:cytochrome P450
LSTDPDERERQLEKLNRARTVLDVDPPEHTRLRALMTRTFTARTIDASEPMIAGYVDELLNGLTGDRIDLVSQFATMLPVLVICEMLGVAPEERHSFIEIGNAMTRSVDPGVPIETRNIATERLRTYIAGLVEVRRDHPGDDLMTRLIEAAENGRLVNDDELLANTGLLLVAGFETTTNLITNAVYQLLQHPDQLAELRADPALIKSTIEEVLRFDPPTHLMRPRTITGPVEIGGVMLNSGDAVVPILAAANRDPAEFEDPDRFDIRRSVNRHMAFGVGHHLCVGAALARSEARQAVLGLLTRFPDLSLAADEEPEIRPNLALRGFSRLVVHLGRATEIDAPRG